MTRPSAEVRAELERALEDDGSQLGLVYRLSKDGLGKDDIARKVGAKTSNFVYNKRVAIDAILEGAVSTKGPAFAREIARSVLSTRERPGLSDEARQHLDEVLTRLQRVAGPIEWRPAKEKTSVARPATPPAERTGPSLRDQVDAVLRSRVRALVSRITRETGLLAPEYQQVHASHSPNDTLATLVLEQTASVTFRALSHAGRLDLSLEARVGLWSRDLPIRRDVVDGATARLEYFGHHREGRA